MCERWPSIQCKMLSMQQTVYQEIDLCLLFFSNAMVYFFQNLIGMPLFCFNDITLKVGIELTMGVDDMKTFYNIGSEKNWISSAMEDNQNKGTMTVCQLPYNCLATAQILPNDYLKVTLQ